MCFMCTWLASRFSLKSQRMTYSPSLKLGLLFKAESSGREWNEMLPHSSLILSANTQTPVNTPSGQLAGSKWSAILSLMDDTCGLTLYSFLEEMLCSEIFYSKPNGWLKYAIINKAIPIMLYVHFEHLVQDAHQLIFVYIMKCLPNKFS